MKETLTWAVFAFLGGGLAGFYIGGKVAFSMVRAGIKKAEQECVEHHWVDGKHKDQLCTRCYAISPKECKENHE